MLPTLDNLRNFFLTPTIEMLDFFPTMAERLESGELSQLEPCLPLS